MSRARKGCLGKVVEKPEKPQARDTFRYPNIHMTKLYYMQRRTTPAKIEVGRINEEEVILPLLHFAWTWDDRYQWTPDMVINSTNWGAFGEHAGFLTKLASLNGIALKPDMMIKQLENLGCVAVDPKEYQDEFIASEVFADPDLVGAAEYRAIFDLLEEAENWTVARASLEEFKEQAESMLRTLDEEGPDDNG